MEFSRRWGIADRVREAGTPEDYPHTVLYLTALTGFEIARIERPGHGGRAPGTISPERPQRCNQLWLDPILRDRAASFPSVTLRLRCRFESFGQDDGGVIATVQDLATGERERIAADYLVACCGGHSTIAKTLGIEMHGTPRIQSQHLLPHVGAVVPSRQGQGRVAFLCRRAGDLAHARPARRPRAVAARVARQRLFRQCRER
jgi:2-polyprenyl-6-methoxyphenol hydroxylase-like FAD-dependent oxidoreductase